jgi:putative transposase
VQVTMQPKGFQNEKGKMGAKGRGDDDDAREGFVHELAARMKLNYWFDRAKRKCDAISEFYAEFDEESERRGRLRLDPLIRPSRETLIRWKNAGENYWNWRSKFGEASARRRYGGTVPPRGR